MKDVALPLLELRILVLTLGEARHAGWWKSQFLSPVGLSFLERIYPRTTFAAAVRSGSRAALAAHDASIGRGTVFRLFRLPRHLEREIETTLTELSGRLETRFEPLLDDHAALLAQLEALADGATSSSVVGPVSLAHGPGELTPALAAAYLRAFRDGAQAFPYFETEKGD